MQRSRTSKLLVFQNKLSAEKAQCLRRTHEPFLRVCPAIAELCHGFAQAPDKSAFRTSGLCRSGQSHVRGLLAGVKNSKATGVGGISIDDLDWGPCPLPNADAWRTREADLAAGAFDGDLWPGFGNARAIGAVRTQEIGEDGDGVVAFEGYEGRRFG